MAQRVKTVRRRRRLPRGESLVELGGALCVLRPAEVAISEAPGEAPTYAVGQVRLYGLGPPPRPRPDGPSAEWVGDRLASLLPRGLELWVAEAWREEGLRFRLFHPLTRTRAWGVVRRLDGVPLHRTSEAIFEALGDALDPLRASIAEARVGLRGGDASGP
jgi:hypothetical protein